MTIGIRSERELARVAAALIGRGAHLTAPERRLLTAGRVENDEIVRACRDLIAAGQDPLGDAFLALRSPETRRDAGAVYTPPPIVDAMIRWAAARGTPARVVDPGCGSGRFIAAAARAFPDAQLVACDIDPLAILLLRANAAVLDFADRLDTRLAEYRLLDLPAIAGATLYIGNPPYVRHHKIGPEAKSWLHDTAARLGFKASRLAGLHVHFFVRTREIAKPGDWGAFVTSSEWLDVNYGSVLREMLGDGLGGCSLQIFAPSGMPFGETMTTGAITTFLVGNRPRAFTVREIASVEELEDLDTGRHVPWEDMRGQDRWSQLMRPQASPPAGMIPLGDVFRVHRGTVTGGNAVFVAGAYPGRLSERFLVPAVTKAKDLLAADPVLTAHGAATLRRVIDIPPKLDGLTPVERRQVEAFKAWAARHGADRTFTARHRRAWWSVGLRKPAAILCTYMARRAPVFVRNLAGVPHINIAHGLYPKVPMTAADLDAYAAYLSRNVCTSQGRTYAGGLTKFEPKEIERLLVPCLNDIHEHAHPLDARSIDGGRSPSEGNFPSGAA